MNTVIIFLASYLYLIIVALAVIAFILSKNKKRLIMNTAIALPLSYFLGKILGALISSPRPYMIEHVQPLIHAATDNGFPSDHVLLTATLSLIVLTRSRRLGISLCLLTVFVGIGRVLASAHHPVDVIGSWVISLVVVLISSIIVQKFYLQFAHRTPKVKGI